MTVASLCCCSLLYSEGAVDVCSVLLAIFLPPLGVFLKRECRIEFWICVLLTILGYIPGIIYALCIIFSYA
eukprot:SM000100S09459  [mRNA]  locus=s100:390746:391144:- [translate_table: standard]